MSIIRRTLRDVTIGEPVVHMNLAMFPLLGGGATEPEYITFEDALATGRTRVTEISKGGSVPELRFENGCDRPVLLLDGEELIGAKQNRMLNLTIMVPANSTITIPVSCVEAGRWNSVSEEFRSSGRAQYAGVRASKMGQVSASMRHMGSRHSNQSAVWADIESKLHDMDVISETRSANDIYERHHRDVEDYVGAIGHVPRQCGAVFAIDGRVTGLDLFDHAITLHRMLPKLVRSYAMDALGRKRAGQRLDSAQVDRLLTDLAEARGERFEAVGLGHDLRLSGRGCEGAALEVDDRIVHLCAFTTASADRAAPQNERSRVASASARRRRFH